MRVLPILGLAVVCAGFGCSRAAPPREASAPGSLTTAGGAALQRIDGAGLLALVRREPAPVTVVNVWASWCVPCREEFPGLLAAVNALAGRGVRLVLVSTDFDEQLGDVRRFLAQQGVRRTTYLKTGPDQAFIDTLDTRWSGALPATFVYDRRGREVAFWEGRANQERFERAIRAALAGSPSP